MIVYRCESCGAEVYLDKVPGRWRVGSTGTLAFTHAMRNPLRAGQICPGPLVPVAEAVAS